MCEELRPPLPRARGQPGLHRQRPGQGHLSQEQPPNHCAGQGACSHPGGLVALGLSHRFCKGAWSLPPYCKSDPHLVLENPCWLGDGLSPWLGLRCGHLQVALVACLGSLTPSRLSPPRTTLSCAHSHPTWRRAGGQMENEWGPQPSFPVPAGLWPSPKARISPESSPAPPGPGQALWREDLTQQLGTHCPPVPSGAC